MAGPIDIEPNRMDAWVGFVHAHAQMTGKLGADLDAAGQVSLRSYDVLVQLSEAGGELRLRDLLQRLVISQPSLSRKIEKLVTAGLVGRSPDPRDGRGLVITLTATGRAALLAAAKIHMSGIDREFGQRLTDDEAAVLATVFRRLRNPLLAVPAQKN
jgi:DNA-binding MarR family transcriptional regulator